MQLVNELWDAIVGLQAHDTGGSATTSNCKPTSEMAFPLQVEHSAHDHPFRKLYCYGKI